MRILVHIETRAICAEDNGGRNPFVMAKMASGIEMKYFQQENLS